MKIRLTNVFAAALCVGMCAQAMLPASAGEIHNRFVRQQQRINQGVKSGQLTQGEYNRDENRLHHIKKITRRDRRMDGGHLTARERRNINQRLNGNSNQIYFTKHNTYHQPGAPTL